MINEINTENLVSTCSYTSPPAPSPDLNCWVLIHHLQVHLQDGQPRLCPLPAGRTLWWSSPPRCCCGASALPGPCPGSGQSWWTHPWASVVVDDLRVRGNGRPCCWRGAAWAWPRRRAGTWPRVSSSVLQGGEVEEVAGLRDRAAAGTCSRRIQITKVLFTHGHDQSCFQSLPSNCHE